MGYNLGYQDDKEIERLEKELISEHKPEWNGGISC